MGVGFYHESLIAITHDNVAATEFFGGVRGFEDDLSVKETIRALAGTRYVDTSELRFQLVGRVNRFRIRDVTSNPLNLPFTEETKTEMLANNRSRYRHLWRNCHSHSAAVLKLLRSR